MRSLFLCLSLAILALGAHYERPEGLTDDAAFEQYNQYWNRTHASDAEFQAKFHNFLIAGAKIAEANKNSPSATFGYTQFADWSLEEFRAILGVRTEEPLKTHAPKTKLQAPGGAINWVAAGKTTPIKNQAQCGSCWAFSAVEEAESANLIAGRGIPDGSPQEIVDCDRSDAGCNGGNPREALGWIQANGLDSDSCYPYTARDGGCASNRCSPAIHISQVIPIPGNENSMYQSLESMPLSICCDAEPWQYYTGGILHAAQCGYTIDHAIQLVGYSPNSGGYWIVRNSWGTSWGEAGYIYLAFGENTCGITSLVTGARA
jgi:C1A family cysteine protease